MAPTIPSMPWNIALATLWYVPIGSAIALLVLVLVDAEILG